MALLEIDEVQAQAILDMQLRKLAALERQQITGRVRRADGADRRLQRHPRLAGAAAADRRRGARRDRRTSTATSGRPRSSPTTATCPIEDLIAEEDIVVTITRGGYAKRTKTDLYRAQKRGGKGVRGAQLRQDDIVEHFFVTTTHHWLLALHQQGPGLPGQGVRAAGRRRGTRRGQHLANLLAMQPDEHVMEVLALRDYDAAPYLVLATRSGLVKKTRLSEYDSPRSGGLIAINLREDDEVIAARLVSEEDDLLLVSTQRQSIRFTASDEALRPMGRATSGVIGMRFAEGDELLAMNVVSDGEDVLGRDRGRVRQADPRRAVSGSGPWR